MSNTGTYIYVEGRGVVKVSDRVPILKKTPDWARRMDPDSERRLVDNKMTSMERRKEAATI